MKILLHSRNRYPAGGFSGTGIRANPYTTGGAAFVHDHLAKGLAELGHEVLYHVAAGYDPPLPEGVRYTDLPASDIDILHHSNSHFVHIDWTPEGLKALCAPWLVTCHVDTKLVASVPGHRPGRMPDNWVVVSETLARSYDHPRSVPNGVDPGALIYSTTKQDYFLFVSRADVAFEKGLGLSLALSQSVGFPLTVMACSTSDRVLEDLKTQCEASRARFVGDVRGRQKAELFAGARALLFPTTYEEGCPLVIAEALMSGTPVITSPRGACPEMVSPDVGFVCHQADDYVQAIGRIDSIRPEDCRARAMETYHYIRMAQAYVQEYQLEIDRYRDDPKAYFDRAISSSLSAEGSRLTVASGRTFDSSCVRAESHSPLQ
jgi:glycosyltransferase involved in cell wall biosynthesis